MTQRTDVVEQRDRRKVCMSWQVQWAKQKLHSCEVGAIYIQ